MKKSLCLILAFALCILCGCSEKETSSFAQSTGAEYVKGVWFSYSEIDTFLLSGNFGSALGTALDNCEALGITDVFFHTRAFCDALYNSQYFPIRKSMADSNCDALQVAVEACHKRNIRIHAWINPYRVKQSDSDLSTLEENSIAYKILNDESTDNDTDICVSNGIWLNPASENMRRLIIDGIREIALGYEVDGIHIDDYFYPTTDPSFDAATYSGYCEKNENPLSLGDWRRVNVNALISGCYTAVKFIDKDIVFSVSPAASIERNYDSAYADIEAWIDSGCVDWIIPQLYFGFDYPMKEYRFENLVKQWTRKTKKSGTRLIVGLAAYKVGTDAEPDNTEWADDTLLSRQVSFCAENGDISGHCYFSYSSLFGDSDLQISSRSKLK